MRSSLVQSFNYLGLITSNTLLPWPTVGHTDWEGQYSAHREERRCLIRSDAELDL